MKNTREPRLPSAGQGWTVPEWLCLALLFALLMPLSGCGTMASPSDSPPLYAPAAVTAAVSPPVPLATGATLDDLLDNIAINGELANELRTRLLAIQQWARSIGAMK